MKIAKRFTFDAAHWLPNVPQDHKCKRLHGHTYSVEIVCSGPLDDRGFICDFSEIADSWRYIHDMIDHKCLNEVGGLENPTCENLASWIADRLSGIPVSAVRVHESSTTWCEVTAPFVSRAG